MNFLSADANLHSAMANSQHFSSLELSQTLLSSSLTVVDTFSPSDANSNVVINGMVRTVKADVRA